MRCILYNDDEDCIDVYDDDDNGHVGKFCHNDHLKPGRDIYHYLLANWLKMPLPTGIVCTSFGRIVCCFFSPGFNILIY